MGWDDAWESLFKLVCHMAPKLAERAQEIDISDDPAARKINQLMADYLAHTNGLLIVELKSRGLFGPFSSVTEARVWIRGHSKYGETAEIRTVYPR